MLEGPGWGMSGVGHGAGVMRSMVKAQRRRCCQEAQASLWRFACGGRFTEGGAVQWRVGSILSSSWVPSEVAL